MNRKFTRRLGTLVFILYFGILLPMWVADMNNGNWCPNHSIYSPGNCQDYANLWTVGTLFISSIVLIKVVEMFTWKPPIKEINPEEWQYV